MFPILVEFWKIKIYTYGLFVALGFIVGAEFSAREAKRRGENPARVLDITFWVVILGVVGARLLFIIMNITDYISEPLKILKIWEGGLAWYGGVLGATLAIVVYSKKFQLSIKKILDIIAAGTALGLSIGRWGCFSAGCCFGRTTSLPWAVIFKDPKSLAVVNVPIHPTQVYESFVSILIFAFLRGVATKTIFAPKEDFFILIEWALIRFYALGVGGGLTSFYWWDIPFFVCVLGVFYLFKLFGTKVNYFEGAIGSLWFIMYSIARFFLEYVRHKGGITGWIWEGKISTSHIVGITIFAIFSYLFFLWKKTKTK